MSWKATSTTTEERNNDIIEQLRGSIDNASFSAINASLFSIKYL